MPRTMVAPNGKEYVLQDSERQRTEIWSRIMGYYAQRSLYNAGKKSEFADRKYYEEPTIPDVQPTLPID